MMNKSKENYIRLFRLIRGYVRGVLIELLKYFIKSKGMGFQEFLQIHAHDILHLCFKNILCCRCHGHVPVTRRKLMIQQLDQLLDKSGRKLPGHIQSFETSIPYCCSPVRSDISIKHLDLLTLTILLVEVSTVCSETTKKAIEELVIAINCLNDNSEGEISNDEFRRDVAKIEGNLLTISDVYGKSEEVTTKIKGVLEREIPGLEELRKYLVSVVGGIPVCWKCGETLHSITEFLEHIFTHKDSKKIYADLDYLGAKLKTSALDHGRSLSQQMLYRYKSAFDPVEAYSDQQHMRGFLNFIMTGNEKVSLALLISFVIIPISEMIQLIMEFCYESITTTK